MIVMETIGPHTLKRRFSKSLQSKFQTPVRNVLEEELRVCELYESALCFCPLAGTQPEQGSSYFLGLLSGCHL